MTTTTNDMNKTESNLPTTPPAVRAAEIRENTRRVLFPERDPRAFDCGSYAITFGFCDSAERKRLFEALKQAWAWGRSCGIGKRGGTQGETAGRKETQEGAAGMCHTIRRGEGVCISRLDCQKGGPAIFGGGLLLSDTAAEAKERAKERACCQPKVLELSEREKRIIRQLGQQKQNNSTGYESG